jgi:hypothetical protein
MAKSKKKFRPAALYWHCWKLNVRNLSKKVRRSAKAAW